MSEEFKKEEINGEAAEETKAAEHTEEVKAETTAEQSAAETEKPQETAEAPKAEEKKTEPEQSGNKVVDLVIKQLMDSEVSEAHAKEIIDELTVKDDKQPIDNILANVYQKIVLKLGEIQPLTAGKAGVALYAGYEIKMCDVFYRHISYCSN